MVNFVMFCHVLFLRRAEPAHLHVQKKPRPAGKLPTGLTCQEMSRICATVTQERAPPLSLVVKHLGG
ncbi:MAG: hypothetical protein II381_14075, partial [Victivallales bacterium]|nr:hypothetical protein [Victivallales bacterium]